MGDQLLLSTAPAPLPPMVTCFSLDQPYAGLVAAGLKDETRTYKCSPRTLLICSTGRSNDAGMAYIKHRMTSEGRNFWALPLTCGVALAVVDVVGCRVLVEADLPRSWFWDPTGDAGKTRYIWTIANVRRVAPFAVSGLQGFARKVPREQVEQALAAWRSR